MHITYYKILLFFSYRQVLIQDIQEIREGRKSDSFNTAYPKHFRPRVNKKTARNYLARLDISIRVS